MECYLVKKVCSKLPGSGKITTLCACMAAKPRHTTMRTHRIEKLALLSLVLSIVENNHANVSIIDGVANKTSYKFCYKRHIATAHCNVSKNAVRGASNPHRHHKAPPPGYFISSILPPLKRADSAIETKSALK